MRPPLSDWPEAAVTLVRTFGVRGGFLRARHEVRRRASRFREAPRHAAPPPGRAGWLVIDPDTLRAATDESAAVQRAERVLAGEYQAFRNGWLPLPADADGWLRHPETGRQASVAEPWWTADHLNAGFGDIKAVWEPARFGWLYDLVRGYVLTGDDRFARAAAERIAAWDEAAPAFRGLHWSCGQETAIRAEALLYAEANLSGAPSFDETTQRRVSRILAASGERIADAIGYAVSQRNNHAISEATGLVLLGARFAGQHPEADSWLESGCEWLETVIAEQFATDGWYIQHSFTYMRLALEQCVLAEHALRSRGAALSQTAAHRLRAAAGLLTALVSETTGHVPLHGPSDGAFVFPATLAGYRDFRPVLTALAATWAWPLPEDIPPDAEVAAWLGAPMPALGPQRTDAVLSGASGWAVARVGSTTAFLRAGRYTSRPGHLDALHLTVRFGPDDVVVDPGTYSYNAPPPWKNGFSEAAVHNGPLVDGAEPGLRGPRFLWYLWPKADLLEARASDGGARIVAERPGEVRRTLTVQDGEVQVRDEALRPGALAVTWLPSPNASPNAIDVTEGAREVRAATDDDVRGWLAPYYGQRIPGQSVIATSEARDAATIVTRIQTLDPTLDAPR